MKNSDFISPAARLTDSMKQLQRICMETREESSDSVSRKVEDEYLVPLSAQVRAMLDTIEKMSGVMSQAERACSHSRERGPIL